MTLDYWDSPALGKIVVVKHLQHLLVPEILPLGTFILVYFLVGECDILVIGKVEVILDYIQVYLL